MESNNKLPENLKKYRLSISTRGYYIILMGFALFLIGLYYSSLLLMALAYFLLLIILFDLRKVYRFSPDILEVKRRLDRKTLFKGNYLYSELEIENKSDNPMENILVEDFFPIVFEHRYGLYKTNLTLDKGDSVQFSYILEATEKGGYKIGPLRVVFESPYRLFFIERYVPIYDDVVVFPSIDKVEKMYHLAKSTRSSKIFGMHRGRRVGSGTDFYGIREYTRYDDYRAIDWKASARAMKLMVREFTEEIPLNILIMLDSGYSMGYGKPITKFNYAVDTALFLARIGIDNRDKVGLLVFSDAVNAYVHPRASASNIDLMLRELAMIEPRGGKNYTRAVQYFVENFRLSSLIVLLSDLEGDLEDLFEAIRLARIHNHKIFVLYFYTPYFEEEVEEEGESLVSVAARSVIFDRLLETRMQIVKEIIARGGHIIIVSPQYLLPILLEQYFKSLRRR